MFSSFNMIASFAFPLSAGPSELDLSLLADSCSLADVPTKFDEQVDSPLLVYLYKIYFIN